MVKCSNCGVEVADTFDSCPNCGNDLNSIKEDSVKTIKCENCGSEIQEGQLVCPSCGNKVSDLKLSKKCPHCGSKVDDDAQFCDSCGKSLTNSSIASENANSNISDDSSSTNDFNTSFVNVISNINYVRLGVYSIICLVLSILLTIIFMTFLQGTASSFNIPDYTAAFITALIIAVIIFAAYQKDIVEGGILGLTVGLLLGLLESPVAGMYFGTSIGYDLFFGSNTSTFIIVGLIFGIISNLFLKNRIVKHFDLTKYIG